jgi:signal transduction histidine kinase
VRLRLTFLYGGLFLVSGVGLLAVTYLLMARQFPIRYSFPGTTASGPRVGSPERPPPTGVSPLSDQHAVVMHEFLLGSAIALGIMAFVAIGLGWLVAGRVLQPLRTMTNTARRISEDNLHERLAVQGPGDELKDLGDTIDGLLGRLEGAFDAQRRFVANASHELRTPLTVERVMLEMALADPTATAESLRSTCEELLAASQQQEELIQALLTLARSQRGIDHREAFDLAAVTSEVLSASQLEAQRRGLRIGAALTSAPSMGDRRLTERLVANLVDNALRHNVAGGWVYVMTGIKAGRAVVSVANSGPVVPPEEVSRLFQPFQQLGADRTSRHAGGTGVGLGLSIVDAIAAAHGASLIGRARAVGGLDIEVAFPPPGVRASGRPSRAVGSSR